MRTAAEPQNSKQASPRPKEKPPGFASTEQLSGPCGAGNQAMLRLLHAGALQTKLTIDRPGDAQEREADAVAEQVMGIPDPGLRTMASPARIQRKCAACQGEEEETIQRKETAGPEPVVSAGREADIAPRAGAGEPLPQTVRQFFEPRFGKDFSRVRVHTDVRAAQAAQSIQARAFTMGADIAFARGEYAPETPGGRTLLAHELTHTIQQGRASGPKNQAQREPQDAPGTSTFTDTVTSAGAVGKTPGVYGGKVKRQEFDPHGQRVHNSTVNVQYDENACKVTLPTRVRFRHPHVTDLGVCPAPQGQASPTQLPKPMDASAFNKVRQEYLREANKRLNGWYSVRLENCEKSPCQGKDIPIQVEITEVVSGSPAEYDIVLLNMNGRACVSYGNKAMYLFSNDHNSETYAHESLHMTLGGGDEYHETDPTLSQNPSRDRENDWSLGANSDAFQGWALLHERHFSHVIAFLQSLQPKCSPKLTEVQRPLEFHIQVDLAGGYVRYAGGNRLSLDAALTANFPLTRLREWNFAVGAAAHILNSSPSLDEKYQSAYLLGLRVSLEHSRTPSAGGLHLGSYAEVGGGSFGLQKNDGSSDAESGAYAEIGGSLGYRLPPRFGSSLIVGVEAAAGTRLGNVGDPQTEKWFRAGLLLGARF